MRGLNYNQIALDVRNALLEDRGSGDVSAALLAPDLLIKAQILSREPMVMAGIPWANAVFAAMDGNIQVNWAVDDGMYLDAPRCLAEIEGNARAILTAERVVLNFLQTLSATATQTYQYVSQLKGTHTRLLDTRKTLPGLRYAQKYAVTCGGGMNHRMGLYDAFLIKENHIKAHGSIARVIEEARRLHPDLLVEIEVENIPELKEALAAKPDRILLDNFTIESIQEAVNLNAGIPLEASGGVDLTSIRQIAQLGVDFISVGAITKSIQAIDLSLLVK